MSVRDIAEAFELKKHLDQLEKEIYLPKAALTLIHKLEECGYETYLVGGCVRDSLLGIVPKDWDLCTSALPEQAMTCLKDYHIIPTGIRHGTITVMADHEPYEITTFRVDGVYSDNRRPDQAHFISSLREDLARRDFTINAMAYHPDRGIIDYYGGTCDLAVKQIRCVGNAGTRFREDALRMMRALRFASGFGFSLCEETQRGIQSNKALLSGISAERIRDEFHKLLLGSNVETVLENYFDVFFVFIPELEYIFTLSQELQPKSDCWQKTTKAIALAPEDLAVRLALFFEFFTETPEYKTRHMAQTIMKRMRFDNNLISQVSELVGCPMPEFPARRGEIKRYLRRMGAEQFRRLMAKIRAEGQIKEADIILSIAEDILKKGECFSLQTLAVSGHDLLAAGLTEGVEIGRRLNELLDMVMDGEIINEKKALLKAFENDNRHPE